VPEFTFSCAHAPRLLCCRALCKACPGSFTARCRAAVLWRMPASGSIVAHACQALAHVDSVIRSRRLLRSTGLLSI
jgi:hypothetical protein